MLSLKSAAAISIYDPTQLDDCRRRTDTKLPTLVYKIAFHFHIRETLKAQTRVV